MVWWRSGCGSEAIELLHWYAGTDPPLWKLREVGGMTFRSEDECPRCRNQNFLLCNAICISKVSICVKARKVLAMMKSKYPKYGLEPGLDGWSQRRESKSSFTQWKNTEFQGASVQKPPQPSSSPEKHVNSQNETISETLSGWENMVAFYLSSDSGQELLIEIAESSQCSQNPQVPSEEDFYADILRDDIVKLDDPTVLGNRLIDVPRLQTESLTTRVLPLPSMVDKQMQSMLQRLPLQNDIGEENNISM